MVEGQKHPRIHTLKTMLLEFLHSFFNNYIVLDYLVL